MDRIVSKQPQMSSMTFSQTYWPNQSMRFLSPSSIILPFPPKKSPEPTPLSSPPHNSSSYASSAAPHHSLSFPSSPNSNPLTSLSTTSTQNLQFPSSPFGPPTLHTGQSEPKRTRRGNAAKTMSVHGCRAHTTSAALSGVGVASENSLSAPESLM